MDTMTQDISPKERIIETALLLFYKQGYLATGINQIIAESNVAKATFYTHFPSKEMLCVAYLQARHDIWMQWLQESVEQNANAKEKLFGIFTFLKSWMTECEFRGCAFLNIASEIPAINNAIRNEVVTHKDGLQVYIREIIKDMINEHQSLSHWDDQHLANIVYVLTEGAIVASQNYHNIWPISAASEAIEKLL
jgi:AcrR family transcriptional regulator